MDWKRKNLVVRLTLLSTMITGIFWGTWYLSMGSVPVSHLFGISRWWDVLLVPPFTAILTLLLTNGWVLERILVRPSMAGNFFGISLIGSPFLGLVFGLEIGLMAGVIFLPLSLMTLYLDDIARKKIKKFLLGN
ncbi:MAG: hypothetical protein AAB598_01695 [Patescibacteria group bacterium]